MDSILFSVMCQSQARDLFALAHVCTNTRAIFASKSFWKTRFTLLGIQHKEPSLQVYKRYLKIEKKLLDGQPSLIYYKKFNLEELEKLDKDGVTEHRKTLRKRTKKTKEAKRFMKERNLSVHHYLMREIRSLPFHYLSVEKEKNRYTIYKRKEVWCYTDLKVVKEPLLEDLNKTEALNVLLCLYS
ncbi:hypothetical protein BQ9231_00554 [Cedratvirus lausannensis]|uniref:F-box domain-containing protein n=1 Tax=Cedratvirus lausannensis TaxID=2023205 RepID=A0A285PYW9_9VIRU|nr:hypothetical protein BQ9231_00554 [Cedratvirus lausannensis]